MQLNVNTDAAVVYTNQLEKMHRSAFPNAVRGALNKAAFNTKTNTLLNTSSEKFINRSPNFFKANSRVDMAKGWKISEMASIIGMTSQGLSGGNNFAVKDLEQQEEGGTIKGKSYIPLDPARGGSGVKAVRPGNRLSKIKRIVNARDTVGKSRRQKFLGAAIKAGVGGYVLGNFNKKILWRIEAISKKRKGNVIRKKALYSFKEKRTVKVSGTDFMKKASLQSAIKIESFFIAEAKRQIEKLK
jgi:hypothetical protein